MYIAQVLQRSRIRSVLRTCTWSFMVLLNVRTHCSSLEALLLLSFFYIGPPGSLGTEGHAGKRGPDGNVG